MHRLSRLCGTCSHRGLWNMHTPSIHRSKCLILLCIPSTACDSTSVLIKQEVACTQRVLVDSGCDSRCRLQTGTCWTSCAPGTFRCMMSSRSAGLRLANVGQAGCQAYISSSLTMSSLTCTVKFVCDMLASRPAPQTHSPWHVCSPANASSLVHPAQNAVALFKSRRWISNMWHVCVSSHGTPATTVKSPQLSAIACGEPLVGQKQKPLSHEEHACGATQPLA